MSAPKSSYQTFQTDWQKTASWAQSQGISAKQYLPIYQLDASRLLQYGTPMSQAERTRAVLAGAGMGLTQLPSDNPSPTDVFGNVMKNAQQIFTGLNPISIVKNLFDTASATVEHPMTELVNPMVALIRPNRNVATFSNSVLSPHSPLALIPGMADFAQVMQGGSGARSLAANPLTSILDILPFSRLTGGALARTDLAESVAAKAGVTTEELKGMGAGQLAWKMLKNKPTKNMALKNVPLASGDEATIYAAQSTGELVSSYRNHFGAGADQAEIEKSIRVHEQVGQQEKVAILETFNKAWAKLGKEDTYSLNTYLATKYHITDFRPDAEIMADPALTIDQRAAFQHTVSLDNWFTNQKLNAGELKVVQTAAGPEIYLADRTSRAAPVIAAKDQLDKAIEDLHTGGLELNRLLTKTQDVDHIMMGFFDQVKKYRETVYEAIKASLPDIAQGSVYDTLKGTLRSGERLDRAGKNIAQQNKRNLETFLGLDERREQRIYRGSKESAPFEGTRAEWSDNERSAWYDARVSLLREYRAGGSMVSGDREVELAHKWANSPDPKAGDAGYNAFQSKVRDQAMKRLEITDQIHEVKVHAPVPAGTARILSEVVGPGGLIDQAIEAFEGQQFEQLHALTKAIDTKMSRKSFDSPTKSQSLDLLTKMTKGLYAYAKTRDKATQEAHRLWTGEDRKGNLTAKSTRDSVAAIVKRHDAAADKFLAESIKNPPAVWDNYYQLEYSKQLMQKEEGQQMAKAAISQLRTEGLSETALTALHENPQSIVEMSGLSARASLANHMLPNVDPEVAAEVADGAKKTVYDLRSKGLKPLYLATLHPSDRLYGTGAELYNISLGRTRISREQATFERSMDNNNGTIYHFQAGMNKAVHEMVVRDHEIDFQQNELPHYLFDRADVEPIIRSYFGNEMAERAIGPNRPEDIQAFYDQKLEEWGLVAYDPKSLFSTSAAKFVSGKTMYIHKDILSALGTSFQRLELPGSKFYDKATGIFRTSILGYSPRFTAHIMVGGTMMLAAKSTPEALKHLNLAWRMACTHEVPPEVLSRFNLKPEDITTEQVFSHSSTQEGFSDVVLKHAMGYSAGQFAVQEYIARAFGKEAADLKHPDWFTHYLKVIPEMNYTLTRFSTSLQRSVSFLDGIAQASKRQSFYEDVYDEAAKKMTRVKHDMTPQQAAHEAMQHVEKVMGDVRAMTPIERNFLTRAFPFWGWTRHVLQFVMQYPSDHPYRAMFLSQMSRISAQEQPAGLPLRAQLLFFLGNPDQSGNVSAIDMRAANPLRDTAGYMSLSGWLSALNPVLTAPFAKVDPSITFGTNVLYPTVAYSSLYGSNEAQASGTWLGAAEGEVPELQSLDAALNLSGQYAYLQKGNKNAFIKKVFEGLNIPFLQVQSLNLRQIAATNEIDRYHQAANAASTAWTSGDFSGLKGYGLVPDPRNAQYQISPAQLQALYNQTATQFGTSGGGVAAVTPALQSPSY